MYGYSYAKVYFPADIEIARSNIRGVAEPGEIPEDSEGVDFCQGSGLRGTICAELNWICAYRNGHVMCLTHLKANFPRRIAQI